MNPTGLYDDIDISGKVTIFTLHCKEKQQLPERAASFKNFTVVSNVICCSGEAQFSMPILLKALYFPRKHM